jgi:hypothetical protein
MIKERAWPARAMYILIAVALAMSLIIMAAPANKVSAQDDDVISEWDRVTTPTTDGWVLAPNSTIIDYALADGGDVAFAIVDSHYGEIPGDYFLLKSDDAGATWTDITDDAWATFQLLQVATDWEDPDFVAVALYTGMGIDVYVSDDGGDTFEDANQVMDGTAVLNTVSDLAVSYESAGDRYIAIGGMATTTYGAGLFRSRVTGDSAGGWEDATADAGWDNRYVGDTDTSDDILSWIVTDIIFSPNWGLDKTVLVTTVAPGDITNWTVHLQCGTWGTSEGWNEFSTLGIEAVPILENEVIATGFMTPDARGIAGITLPEDYNSKNTDDRVLWVWVNYWDMGYPASMIMRVEDDSADPVGPMGQIEDGEVWLTNISYHGTIAEGEAIAGLIGTGTDFPAACCEGVQVYRNDGIRNMDICCERWHDACKPPTGTMAMAVSYVGDDKAYAVALWGVDPIYDEGAWSVTFDDGDTWNQLSLIDTYIDYISDVAVSPDCNKTMLVTVNLHYEADYSCGCDSVWLHAEDLPEAEEYSGKWIRTWCGSLVGVNGRDYPYVSERGLLRLPPMSEETTGDNVFLVDRMSGNVYWNDLEGLACWDPIGSTTVTEIVDLAAQDTDTLFALDANGDVSMFDGDEWQEEVDSDIGVDNAWTIAVWGDHILVGGRNGDVSYSDDGGESFALVEDEPSIDGFVTVAFDSYFDVNDVVYAATNEGVDTGGVFRWVVGESTAWKDLRAESHSYTGLVVDNADGNPFTSADTGGVIYASYVGTRALESTCWTGTKYWETGVARRLYPTQEVICGVCGEWDYLTLGLSDVELFNMAPNALKICGCLTSDSNSHLFAIDGSTPYDMDEFLTGAVWTFEDCYAKKAPEITSPADGFVVPADPCSCYSVPFTIVWDRLCDACSYSLEFALDEDFTMPVSVNEGVDLTDIVVSGETPSFSIMGGAAGGLSCETTYYYRVRAANAENCQIIHSWWSEPMSVTIAPSTAAGEITLVSPEPGATDVAIEDVGFSWHLLATADSFDWVLDNNSDLSSPVESKTGLTTTAYQCTQTLEYDTTYYWQVTAYNEGAAISTSAVGTFRTMPETVPIEEEEVTTPFWVWVVIGIGAALVIVVIVLIFRTRRV